MAVIINWTFVNQSEIFFEEATVEPIRDHIRQYMEIRKEIDKYPDYGDPRFVRMPLKDMEARSILINRSSAVAKSIGTHYPMLGDSLQRSYWGTIIPRNLTDFNKYKLMQNDYIADVQAQSKAGTVLHKRTNLGLYRMLADGYDSGWKVLYKRN
jgi:hypothetical protein